MNKFLVLACILLSLGLVYFKRKNDHYKRELEKQQKLVVMLRAGIEKPLEPEPEKPNQLINLATSAISPLIAFIGPNLLKKKNSFLKESVNASDYELSQQLRQLDDDDDGDECPKIVELPPTTPLPVMVRLNREADAIAKEIQTFVETHNGTDETDEPIPELISDINAEPIPEAAEPISDIPEAAEPIAESELIPEAIPDAIAEALVEIEASECVAEKTPKKTKRKMKTLYAHPALDPCFGQESCPIR
jgi:hypothetical protein